MPTMELLDQSSLKTLEDLFTRSQNDIDKLKNCFLKNLEEDVENEDFDDDNFLEFDDLECFVSMPSLTLGDYHLSKYNRHFEKYTNFSKKFHSTSASVSSPSSISASSISSNGSTKQNFSFDDTSPKKENFFVNKTQDKPKINFNYGKNNTNISNTKKIYNQANNNVFSQKNFTDKSKNGDIINSKSTIPDCSSSDISKIINYNGSESDQKCGNDKENMKDSKIKSERFHYCINQNKDSVKDSHYNNLKYELLVNKSSDKFKTETHKILNGHINFHLDTTPNPYLSSLERLKNDILADFNSDSNFKEFAFSTTDCTCQNLIEHEVKTGCLEVNKLKDSSGEYKSVSGNQNAENRDVQKTKNIENEKNKKNFSNKYHSIACSPTHTATHYNPNPIYFENTSNLLQEQIKTHTEINNTNNNHSKNNSGVEKFHENNKVPNDKGNENKYQYENNYRKNTPSQNDVNKNEISDEFDLHLKEKALKMEQDIKQKIANWNELKEKYEQISTDCHYSSNSTIEGEIHCLDRPSMNNVKNNENIRKLNADESLNEEKFVANAKKVSCENGENDDDVVMRESVYRNNRPTTRYLPVVCMDAFDLRSFLEEAGHNLPSVHLNAHNSSNIPRLNVDAKFLEGSLKKVSRLRILIKQWVRFDIISRQLIFYKDSSKDVCKQTIPFHNIQGVYVDYRINIKSSKGYCFCLKTNKKLMVLLAPCPYQRQIWIDALTTGAHASIIFP